MSSIEEYFSTDYIEEKKELDSNNNILRRVLTLFHNAISRDGNGFKYEIKDGEKLDSTNSASSSYSPSTNSMILYGLRILTGSKSNLSKDLNFKDVFDKTENRLIEEVLKEKYIDNSKNEKDKKLDVGDPECFLFSSTFGKDDIFSLGWTMGIVEDKVKKIIDDNHQEPSKTLTTLEKFLDKIKIKSKEILENPNEPNKIFKYDDTTKYGLEHAFPVLRAVQIADKRGGLNGIEKIAISKAYFENKIHNHLSYSEIVNSNFDTAELVFSLEGLLRINKALGVESINRPLINRIFQVVSVNQTKSPYWRPLKPFITTSQGMALLPLSVEIANSMLRICKLLEKHGEFYFSENINLFKVYTDWLRSRITSINIYGEGNKSLKLSGWHSEHVNKIDIIHPWETIQVAQYLFKYNNILQEHIGRKSLELANLHSKLIKFETEEDTWDKIKEKYEPVSPDNWNEIPADYPRSLLVYDFIGENYIKPRQNKEKPKYFSLLLYGPPGTGKTGIAEKIAMFLKMPLITITPSDFLASGANDVEARAKVIFKTLQEQKDTVILFDEIDRLVLDRDSKFYQDQGDVFQFMTPSMLVKIKDLREAENSIFIIGTNYEDRIDQAIKRTGRIDKRLLVMPPNKKARIKIFTSLIQKNLINQLPEGDKRKKYIEIISDWVVSQQEKLLQLANKTIFWTYGDINALIKEMLVYRLDLKILNETEFGKKNEDNVLQNLDEIILKLKNKKGSISLESYKGRFRKNSDDKEFKGSQQPFREFYELLLYYKEVDPRHNFTTGNLNAQVSECLLEFDENSNQKEKIEAELERNINDFDDLLKVTKEALIKLKEVKEVKRSKKK